MSSAGIVVLGAIAGFTIFFGLPVGRLRPTAIGIRTLLGSTAIGILLFLLVDVLEHGFEPVSGAMHAGRWAAFAGLAAVFVVGLSVGLLSLVGYERWMGRRARRRPSVPSLGPGAAAVAEFESRPGFATSPARRLALLIAVGIGLHNFAEGLAIGQSAARGEIGLALLLVIGFGLHNATEGFGIVAPLAAERVRPGWGFLATLGLIGGGPTFLGTLVGQAAVNEAFYVGFLALAAGSILYVVVQLIGVTAKLGRKELLYVGILLGLLLGYATELVVAAGGG